MEFPATQTVTLPTHVKLMEMIIYWSLWPVKIAGIQKSLGLGNNLVANIDFYFVFAGIVAAF